MAYNHETAPNQFVEVNNQRYAYRRFGKAGGIPILFLQHFRGTMDNWDPAVTDPLAQDHDLILFDNAGVGLSSGEPASSVPELARHAVAFIKGLNLTSVDLLGFSLGGFVAQQIALDHPGLVRRIVLAGTGPQGGEGMDTYADDVVAHAAVEETRPEDLLFLFFAHTETSQTAGKAFLQRLRTRTAAPDAPASIAVRDAQLQAIGAWGAPNGKDYSRLKEIKQPVFIANGNHDIMVPSINSLILAQNLPNGLLSLYPDSGHGALFQYAELFTAQANHFLRG